MRSIRRKPLALLGALALTTVLTTACVQPETRASNTVQISKGGFGDKDNTYGWSMASFKGKLYVGTARAVACVERATYDFFVPNQGHYKSDDQAQCPADKNDLRLRAEIWQYTPETAAWARVYQSPEMPHPTAAGKTLGRDIGYRGMTVVGDTLYVGSVTANEFNPSLYDSSPPRLLRTTDGTTFDAIDLKLNAQDPGAATPAPFGVIHTPFGYQKPMGIRAMTSVNGQLYITATGGYTGDGSVVRVDNATSATPTFTQISAPDVLAYELESFNNKLYVGTGSKEGYGVWRSSDADPNVLQPVMTGGAGRGGAVASVVAMGVFQNQLYVTASGWYSSPLPVSEVIRVNTSGGWDVVVGNTRTVNGVEKAAISGWPDGFNNIAAAHFWRMLNYHDGLYMGTNDWSWTFKTLPGLEDTILKDDYGFDVYGTCDGTFWWATTRSAFGDGNYNFGSRTMAQVGDHAYIGSTNLIEGTAIYRNDDISPCPAPATAAMPFASSALPTGEGENAAGPMPGKGVPGRLLADTEVCGTVLSWDLEPGSRRYRVRRAVKETAQTSVPKRPTHDLIGVPSFPPAPSAGTVTTDVTTMGEFEVLTTTTDPTYVDRDADPSKDYVYEVIGDAAAGTGAASIAFVQARSKGPNADQATDDARKANGVDVDAIRAQRGVESSTDACSK